MNSPLGWEGKRLWLGGDNPLPKGAANVVDTADRKRTAVDGSLQCDENLSPLMIQPQIYQLLF